MSKVAATTETAEPPTRSLAETIRARRKAIKIEEVADILSLSQTTLYDWVRTRQIPSYRMGTTIRFDPKELADWLDKRKS